MTGKVGVVVIGGGPAGISAAIAASVDGASVLLVEREARLGGKLKQTIHDRLELAYHSDRLTGPEYAFSLIATLEQTNTFVLLQTFVSQIVRNDNIFQLTLCNRHGTIDVTAGSVVFATGCRELTACNIPIHGSRPAGLMTAGTAQYHMNIQGQLPSQRCLVLGSTDLGMTVSRRLAIEGAKVLGVYEAGQSPNGLLQNVTECLSDYDIPLSFSHTITRAFGTRRIVAGEICRVDKSLNPIRGSEAVAKCDAIILAGGLIPENTLAESLGVLLHGETKGPLCDQNFMTMTDGVYCCGNAQHINSSLGFVYESGEIAGRSAARFAHRERQLITIHIGKEFLYSVPHSIDVDMLYGETTIFFRVKDTLKDATVKVLVNGNEVYAQQYAMLQRPEVQRIAVNLSSTLTPDSRIELIKEVSAK